MKTIYLIALLMIVAGAISIAAPSTLATIIYDMTPPVITPIFPVGNLTSPTVGTATLQATITDPETGVIPSSCQVSIREISGNPSHLNWWFSANGAQNYGNMDSSESSAMQTLTQNVNNWFVAWTPPDTNNVEYKIHFHAVNYAQASTDTVVYAFVGTAGGGTFYFNIGGTLYPVTNTSVFYVSSPTIPAVFAPVGLVPTKVWLMVNGSEVDLTTQIGVNFTGSFGISQGITTVTGWETVGGTNYQQMNIMLDTNQASTLPSISTLQMLGFALLIGGVILYMKASKWF
jgi:hypothetical protein